MAGAPFSCPGWARTVEPTSKRVDGPEAMLFNHGSFIR